MTRLTGKAFQGRLARRLIFGTVLFSGTLALIITIAQLLIEYDRDVELVGERFRTVEQSYLGSVIDNVWVADRERLATLLSGITRLPDFSFAEVRVDGRLFVRVGAVGKPGGLERTWPLRYSYRGTEHLIGELTIGADLASARARFIDRAWFIVAANFVKTLLVAIFLFLLVHFLVTRHLQRISAYYGEAGGTIEALATPLRLERTPAAEADELDILVESINRMRERLRDAYDEMRKINQGLEARIGERTRELREEVVQRENNERALAQSEGQLRAILDAALIAIIVIDEAGHILVFNPAASALFGYRPDELIGSNVNILMPADQARVHDDHLTRYQQTGEPHIIGSQRELTGQRKDGTTFPLRLAVSESLAGGRHLFIGMMQDLTERHNFEQALIAAKVAAEQANAAKSEFLARMSHELRTPLNAMLGFSQLLVSDNREPLSETQRDSVDHILRGGHHLLELINEVLDLARVESGRMELLMAPIDLGGLVQYCLRSVTPLAERAHVTLQPCALPAPPLQVWADMTRLRQALLNLISNAIKYNRPDGEVFVELCRDGDWVRIAVRDTGYGFDAEQARQLFQPFSRLEPHSKAEGTGIGLVLTKQLVELMGGRIEVAGEPNVGATFTLVLKRAHD